VNPADVRLVARKLQDLGRRYPVVGGAAMDQLVPTSTDDVDLMLTVSQFEPIIEKLSHDLEVYINVSGNIAGGHVSMDGRKIEFDLLNPSSFSGRRSGDEFFDYVLKHRSKQTELGPTAQPQVVWYTRLMVPDWETYIQKIVRDLGNGAPWRWIEGVKAIARRFGTANLLASRINELQEAARVAGVLRSQGPRPS